MAYVARPATGPLRGELRVPGDKSVSHRAVLFAAMAEGVSHLTGVLDSADVRATMRAVEALGARLDIAEPGGPEGLEIEIQGWGGSGPGSPVAPVDCGNSGTTARLLLGALAGWPVEVTLTGDESLSKRPMRRVTDPLAEMGATLRTAPGGTLPVSCRGGTLAPVSFESPVASAQVKTAVLLAGTRAEGRTSVTEPSLSRDHTERLLPAFGVEVGRSDDLRTSWVDGPVVPVACDVRVPADPSSAAFFVGAALIVQGSEITLRGLALNPTRTGYLRVLERMGADVTARVTGEEGTELIGDVTVRRGPLRGTIVEPAEVPSLVDEVPLLAVVAARAEGVTRFAGVGELRVKESDRLAAVEDALTRMGATVRAGEDWLEVEGPTRLEGAEVDSLGDHRLAMAYAVAGLVAAGPVTVHGFDAVDVSYPRFEADLRTLEG